MTVNWIARSSPNVSYAHFRTERISLTAAIPLFAMRTCTASAHQASECHSACSAHIGDDCVAIVCRDKVLHFARASSVEMVAADEMRRQIVLCRIGARGAVGRPIGSVLCISGHCVCGISHATGNLGCGGGRGEVPEAPPGNFLTGKGAGSRRVSTVPMRLWSAIGGLCGEFTGGGRVRRERERAVFIAAGHNFCPRRGSWVWRRSVHQSIAVPGGKQQQRQMGQR